MLIIIFYSILAMTLIAIGLVVFVILVFTILYGLYFLFYSVYCKIKDHNSNKYQDSDYYITKTINEMKKDQDQYKYKYQDKYKGET